MKRVLNFPQLIFYGVGMIVGSGIYSVIGKAAGIAGGSLWISFLLAALVAVLTALSYAELSSMFPKSGAEYIYLKSIFPTLPFLSFFCGTMMMFSGAATAATVAIAFSGYMQQFVSFSLIGIALVVLSVFTILNIWGLKEASWVNITFTLIEILGLVIFIWAAFNASEPFKVLEKTELTTNTISGAALIIFAYFGFETIVNFSEETQNPQKKIPVAILICLAISAGLYFLVSISALALASPQALSASRAPLSDSLHGSFAGLGKVISGIAMFSTANTVLISMLSTSRIVFSMAREGDLPGVFSRLRKIRETPWVAACFVLLLSALLLFAGGLEILASASSLATMIAFTLINLSVMHLRFVRPDLPRPFRIPGSVGRLPLIPMFAVLSTFGLLFFFELKVYGLAAAFILVALIVYSLKRHQRS